MTVVVLESYMLKEFKCGWQVQIKFLLANEMGNRFEYHLNRQVINLKMQTECGPPGKPTANVLLVYDWGSYSLITEPRAKLSAGRHRRP